MMKKNLINNLYKVAAIGFIAVLLSFTPFLLNADFSGKWVLNKSKSDFGDSPDFVLPKSLQIAIKKTALRIQGISLNKAGADTSYSITYEPGKPLTLVTAEQRTRRYRIGWVDNGQQLEVDYSSSFSGKPDEEEYHTNEHYHLSADGRELIIKKKVNIYNDESYVVKGVYDKQ